MNDLNIIEIQACLFYGNLEGQKSELSLLQQYVFVIIV